MTPAPAALRSGASLKRRVVLATALIGLLGMLVLIGAVLLVTDRTTDREMDQVLSARIAAARDAVVRTGGTAALRDRRLIGGPAWLVDGGRITAGPDRDDLDAPVLRAARAPGSDVAADPLLLRAAAAGSGATVVVSIDSAPYEEGVAKVAAASAVLGVAVVAGIALLAFLAVGRALAPVAEMSRTAAAWSHDRLDRRFALGPGRDEITGLAAVLDGLLERVDGAIRAEQRLTAELAHELRTPLTVIRGEAELGGARPRLRAEDRERYERIAAAADDMGRVMTALLDAARGATHRAETDVRALLEEQAARPGLALPVAVGAVPAGLRAAAPPELLARALAPLIDNAARYGRTEVRLDARLEGDRVALEVADDGPGVPESAGDVFAPGVRDEASAGAGLGLALSRRLARGAGGDAVLRSRSPSVFAVVVPVAGETPGAGPVGPAGGRGGSSARMTGI